MPPPNNVETKYYDLSSSQLPTFHRRGSLTSIACPMPAGPGWDAPPPPTTPSKSKQSSSFFFSRYDKKWRWWHYLSLVTFLLGILEAAALITGYTVLHGQPSPIRIGKKKYSIIRTIPFRVCILILKIISFLSLSLLFIISITTVPSCTLPTPRSHAH